MKIEDYKKLEKLKAYDVLWFELLNVSGYAGCMPDGTIVDRRYYPESTPIQKNSKFGVSEPKDI